MSTVLNPYLGFDGNAREAMEFYRDVFGGTLDLNTYGEFGAARGDDADKIMHSQLETDAGYRLMAADNPPGEEYTVGNHMSVSVTGDDGDLLRGYWEKLSADATVMVALEKQTWGDEFGMCKDRFGITWMVNIGQPTG